MWGDNKVNKIDGRNWLVDPQALSVIESLLEFFFAKVSRDLVNYIFPILVLDLARLDELD